MLGQTSFNISSFPRHCLHFGCFIALYIDMFAQGNAVAIQQIVNPGSPHFARDDEATENLKNVRRNRRHYEAKPWQSGGPRRDLERFTPINSGGLFVFNGHQCRAQASGTAKRSYMKFPKAAPVKLWNVMWVPSVSVRIWLPPLVVEWANAVEASPVPKPTNDRKSEPDLNPWITTSGWLPLVNA